MNLLARDTSSEWCSAALWLDGRVLAREERAGQRHSELIVPMIDGLLREAGRSVKQLDGIAFGAGPGSFTGLRIACGIAQGMAFGAGIRVLPVSTLEALAECVADGERAVCALDARMGELYLAAYRRDAGDWRGVVAPVLCRPETAPLLEGMGWVGCGSGFDAQGAALADRYAKQLLRVDGGRYPHAAQLAAIGARRFAAGASVEPERAAPLYIRDKVAFTVAERAARTAAQSEQADRAG